MDIVPRAQRLAVAKTSLPPCCLRLHPNDSSIVVVGTYDLHKETGARTGSIEVLKLDGTELISVSSYNTSGAILDMKFSPFDDNVLLSCHSTGNVMIWDCKSLVSHGSVHLSLVRDEQLFEHSTLITSIQFSMVIPNTVLLTLTSGEAALTRLTQAGRLTEPELFASQHSLECWTGSFGSQGPLSHVVFTGGDDAALMAHDIREPRSKGAIFNATRLHDAGVVAILPSQQTHNGDGDWNVQHPYALWTGSYDDSLRALDLRVVPPMPLIEGMGPVVRHELGLGGGVWRLIPSRVSGDDRVLACCMYDGARIIGSKDDDLPQVKRYFKRDHESMCYGGDWAKDGKFVVTCSFYDNVVQVWSPDQIE